MRTEPTPLTLAQVELVPKVVLHDHLDGAVRPATLIDLAEQIGHELPSTDPEELAKWFLESASSGSLDRYLETFAHTVAVMQTADALTRIAREAVLDLAADNVTYAELRYAPELMTQGGLTLDEVVAAVQRGIREGIVESDYYTVLPVAVQQIVCAMRQNDRADEVADLAVRWRDRGVCGFDIAGPERGFAASRLSSAFDHLTAEQMPVTIHAGEADGLASIADALGQGAHRLGHGVRLIDDIDNAGVGSLGAVATEVHDRGIAIESCPTSNVQTGAVASLAEHPFDVFYRAGFNVTVNTDNRLMSATTQSNELWTLAQQFGYGLDDIEIFTINAMKASFFDEEQRKACVERVIRPWFQHVRDQSIVTS